MSFSSSWSNLPSRLSLPSLSSSWHDYNPLPTQEDTSIQVKPHYSHYFHSRRVRLFALLVAVQLLLLLAYLLVPPQYIGKLRPAGSVPPPTAADGVDWSRFAYVQYATNRVYLCNSVMLFEILHRLDSKADRLLMYPSNFLVETDEDGSESMESRLLKKAKDEYNVNLQPVEVQHREVGDPTWGESYTKLLAFNQTQYDRVLSLDSDSTVLQTMDELFLIPPAPVAMPRAYWLNPDDRVLSSQLILLQPSKFEYERIAKATSEASEGEYDMEIANSLYRDSCFILPHRPYDLLTGEFRGEKHNAYQGNTEEPWDPDAALQEAKFLHFSDWPRPKPWIRASDAQVEDSQPKCTNSPEVNGTTTCRERELWLGFYSDFAKRRQDICGIGVSKARRHLRTSGPSRVDSYQFEAS